ncbi:MAG: hypothetical protein ABIJ47_00020 [Candidatus Bathyarchaeota archaeon]
MNRDERLKLNDRILVLTLFVQTLILVNQVFTLSIYAQQSYQASMIPTDGGETLQVYIDTDTGRPRGILDRIFRYLRGQPELTSSWLGAWMVDGVERTDAIVSISITVTGSNVLSTATVDYWIEGRPSGGGEPFKFLEATGQSVTVNGAALEDSDDRGIAGHLEAMSLATDQSWTIDYYVYVITEATGAVSGETLTSEITETKFDTKTYELYDPGTWTRIPVKKSDGYVGYARLETNTVTLLDPTTSEDPSCAFGERTPAAGLRQYTAWLCFQNNDAENSGYGSTMLPYVTAGTLIIHEAYIRMQAKAASPAQHVTVNLNDVTSWTSTGVDTWAEWLTRWGDRLPVNVTWNAPTFAEDSFYNTTNIGPVVQALVDGRTVSSTGRMTFYIAAAGDAKTYWKAIHGWYFGYATWYRWPTLFIRWSGYTASWYPLPPLSLASLPITLDVLAWSALIAATALAWRENRRKMK